MLYKIYEDCKFCNTPYKGYLNVSYFVRIFGNILLPSNEVRSSYCKHGGLKNVARRFLRFYTTFCDCDFIALIPN